MLTEIDKLMSRDRPGASLGRPRHLPIAIDGIID
jgi:hypothetical protein